MGPRLFPLIEIPDHGLVANRKMRRFEEGPAAIRVPGPVTLDIAEVLAVDAATRGSDVPHRGEPLHVIGFQ
jgi:hypothetical protein